MGIIGLEYKFKLDQIDQERFETDISGQTLDVVLRKGPGFHSTDGTIYEYLPENATEDSWRTIASIGPDGLMLCIYDRAAGSNDIELFNYLVHEILDICCRVAIEEG